MKNCKSSVGNSSITPFKQKDFDHLLSSQIGKAYGVYCKYHEEKWYEEDCYFLDCSAGNMDPKSLTSPQIFLYNLIKISQFPCRLYLIEENSKTFFQLKINYQCRFEKQINKDFINVRLRNANMQRLLSVICPQKYRYGLLYFDPNGFKLEDYESIFSFLCENPRIDVILNINVSKLNSLRQITKADGFEKYNNFYLRTLLHKLGKDYIWIRDNSEIQAKTKAKFEFIMLFGTNMPDFDIGKENSHFHLIDSKEGNTIIEKHNYTKKEKENGNQ